MRKFKEGKAIQEYGASTQLSRWMLPDGRFLNVPDDKDHRTLAPFCQDDDFRWAIAEGMITLHPDPLAGYLWVRVPEALSFGQRTTFERLIEDGVFGALRELKVERHAVHPSGERYQVDIASLTDPDLIQLFLTDPIALRLYCSENRLSVGADWLVECAA